ncbi:hypothetical protein [Hymenobacter norwichensis]|uniref:hypothetical protein n=1 Tax=Hymenobacter norwichensis TaxID=223903 RepID=UPI0003B64F64|nr:hypothetical protein [Hymenobacter norwichensis]
MGIATSGTGLIGKRGGDTVAYFQAIENLLTHGHYTHILNYLPAYAGRMPGYGAVYGLFRLFLSPTLAYDAVILAQMVLALVALYYLGLLTYQLTKRRLVAYAIMLLHAISPYGAQADLFLLTESFAASALVIGTYYCLLGVMAPTRQNMLLAGSWLAWVVFLRPYMAPLLGLWPSVHIYHSYRQQSWRQLLQPSVLLILPFLVVDCAWTARNWLVSQQFVPLQTAYAGIPFPDDYLAARRFAAALGEDPVEWNSTSLMSWLIRPITAPQTAPQSWQLTQHGTYDSLRWVRQQLQAPPPKVLLSTDPHIRGNQQAAAALRRFHDAVVREKPWLYYVVAPVRLTYYLVLTGGGNSIFAWPFSELAIWQKVIRLLFTCTHWLLMGASLCSYIWWPQRASTGWLLVRVPPIFLILLFVVILRYVEARYFIVVYPLALLSGTVWLIHLAEHIAPRLFMAQKPE